MGALGAVTCLQDAFVQQTWVEEGLVLTGADVSAHQLGVGCQNTSALLVQVHPGHGRHVVDVIIVPETHNQELTLPRISIKSHIKAKWT